MESKGVKVVVIEGNKIEKTLNLQQTEDGKPITIDAVDNGKYMLAEDDTGVAPENITVKRVGDDLYISLEGQDTDHPQLIIHDYYLNQGELIGKGEDGAYYSYVSAYGQDAAAISDDAAQPLALGSNNVTDLADGLVADDSNHELMWALAGLGLLAVAGGVVAIAHNHHHHSNNVSSSAPSDNGGGDTPAGGGDTPAGGGGDTPAGGGGDTPAGGGGDTPAGGGDTPVDPAVTVDSGSLDSIIDDVGTKQGPLKDGDATDDSTPTFNGSGVAPGNTVIIHDTDGTPIGSTTADADGNWSFTPDNAIPDGAHDFSVIVVDGDGNQSAPSNDINVVIDTVAPAASDVTASDADGNDIKGGDTNDNTPTFSGDDAEPNSTIIIYDGDNTDPNNAIGSVTVDENGEWNFTPDTPLDEGDHDISVVVIDDAGNESVPSEDIPFTIDTIAPDAATDLQLMDDVGDQQGPINEGETTDDNAPIFSGSAEANATVIISDNGQQIGTAIAGDDGKWSFTPDALPDGPHSFSTVVEDGAGNQSPESTPIDFTVDTTGIAPTSGSEDFTNDETELVLNQAVTFDSGLVLTSIDSGRDGGSYKNASTATGMHFFAPESFNEWALDLLALSVTKVEFGGPTNEVSFDVAAVAATGGTVDYYGLDGSVIHTENIPVSPDKTVTNIAWEAPAGDKISYIEIHVGSENGATLIRADNFVWGPAQAVAATHEVAATHQDATALNAQAPVETHLEGVINIHDHQTLSQNELLSHATQNLMIADGKEQVAITGDAHSTVELDSSHLAQNWESSSQVTAGGVVYDVYHQQDNPVELLIQHGIDVQHG